MSTQRFDITIVQVFDSTLGHKISVYRKVYHDEGEFVTYNNAREVIDYIEQKAKLDQAAVDELKKARVFIKKLQELVDSI